MYDDSVPIGLKPNLVDDRPWKSKIFGPKPDFADDRPWKIKTFGPKPDLADDRPWKTKNGQRWFGVVKDIFSGFAQAIPLISHSMNIGDKIDKWFG